MENGGSRIEAARARVATTRTLLALTAVGVFAVTLAVARTGHPGTSRPAAPVSPADAGTAVAPADDGGSYFDDGGWSYGDGYGGSGGGYLAPSEQAPRVRTGVS